MPDFNIYQCDLLGLKTNSRLMFKTSKLSKKFFSTLEKQKENLESLRYIFSAEIDKYDVKQVAKKQILLLTDENLYIFDPKDMSL